MTKKLVILDDEPAIGQLIVEIAEAAGVACKYSSDPSGFMQTVSEWEPTHVAIDLKMPEMDGLEVMEHLARLGCSADIIILSGADERVLDAAARSAADYGLSFAGVLTKPFTPKALVRLLSHSADGVNPQFRSDPSSLSPSQFPSLSPIELKEAIQKGYLQVFYQPKIECGTNRLVGFEALSRIRHPRLGLISPDAFIPIAESHDLIYELTQAVLDQSLGFIGKKLAGNLDGSPLPQAAKLKVALNVSCQILRQREFLEELLLACQRYGVAPEQVILELTESAAMENPAESLAMLTRLRVHGFHLSIDDFGVGYSSMLQLVKLPFSEIKIDKSFVLTASTNEESRTVINSVVSLGRSLKLSSTAEGIENAQTLEYLRGIGCDIAQGYYISRPVPEGEILQWMRTQCVNGIWNEPRGNNAESDHLHVVDKRLNNGPPSQTDAAEY